MAKNRKEKYCLLLSARCLHILYPLIYTPLPYSRWLHHMALKYVRMVQLGTYMWRTGLYLVKTG